MTSSDTNATADPIAVDDIAAFVAPERPELDPEATLLCALLYSQDSGEVAEIATHLKPDDFLNPRHGEVFSVLATLASKGEPHSPTRVLSTLADSGRMTGHAGQLLADTLNTVTLLGTPPLGVRSMAVDVLRAAYRRRFHHAVAVLARAVEEAPTGQLFELMVEQGRMMRSETARLTGLEQPS